MFKSCNVYCYSGLYLDEKMLHDLEIKKISGFDLIFMLQNYPSIYSLGVNQLQKVDKNSLIAVLSKDDKKQQEFFYRVKNNSLVIVPIQMYYGISGLNGKLIAYYDDKNIRDAKLALSNSGGIQILAEDIDRERTKISEFNNQYQLRKIYSALTMKTE